MDSYRVLGLMSGTSLDGLDLCLVELVLDGHQWKWHIEHATTRSYEEMEGNWGPKLEMTYQSDVEKLSELNVEYAQFLGRQARDFLEKNDLKADLIASHGHTIFHQPKERFTYQLGNAPELAKVSGLVSVGNFRVEDVALGGQGAPLVPIGDCKLFGEYDYCLNLGGFCNVSYDDHGIRRAFDIAPCNMLLNELASYRGMKFDVDGQMARAGMVVEELLNRWNGWPFYEQTGPKSLGREWYKEHFGDLGLFVDRYGLDNVMATAVRHIIDQLKSVLVGGSVLVTGGGAHNRFLMEEMEGRLDTNITLPDKNLIDYKEALIFALLGVLKLRGEVNVLSSVTGAERDHCAGEVYEPPVFL